MKPARADVGEPERWTARGAPAATAEGAAGAALRRARDATEPRDEEVVRLHARLAARQADGWSSPWRWRLALVLALLLATGGAVGAAGKLLRRVRSGASTESPSAPLAVSRDLHARPNNEGRRQERAVAVVEPAIPAGPVEEESPSPVPGSRVGPPALPAESPTSGGAAPRAFAGHGATGRDEPSRSGAEARLLASAFRALRAGQDAQAALRALDSYDREFPQGVLAGEARIARVEALMALGRRADALALLAAPAGSAAGPPTRNVLVMRGELFAEAGRCGDAVRDFDHVVAADTRGDAEARALFGRAACRLRGGDLAAGARDLRRYLERYPNGASAAAAREALQPGP